MIRKLVYRHLQFACLALFVFASAARASEQMVFAIDVIRHGDRAPIFDIPAAPWPKTEIPLGHLSPKGMQQEFSLGEKFRERYVKQHRLLPEHYSSEAMIVRSTDYDRTLISAECVLLGLYPPGGGPIINGKFALPSGYQPIPIHTRPRAEDPLLVVDVVPGLTAVLDKYVRDTPTWQEKDAQIKPRLKHLSEATGMPLTDIRSVAGLGDALAIYQLHDVPPPAGLSAAEIREVIDDTEWAFRESFRPHQVGDLVSHDLLKTICEYLDTASKNGSDKLKYVLFSAHDTTISGLMSIMHDPVDGRPPYSSDLNFALFKNGTEFKVKVMLNDKPASIPGFVNGEGSLKDLVALLENKG